MRQCSLGSIAMYQIRSAGPHDAAEIITLLWQLAKYEGMLGDFHPSEERLAWELEGAEPDRKVYALLAEEEDRPIGVALYYVGAYSTFKTARKMHLEDVFIMEQYRGTGLLRAFLARVARDALNPDRRFPMDELTLEVLEWNEQAISAYKKLGAVETGCILKNDGQVWTAMSISDESLRILAWP